MKITLVTPPYHTGIIEITGTWPPLSLVYLAGHLREAGHEVTVYDAMSLNHKMDDVEQTLLREKPDAVMVGSFTCSINTAVEVLKTAKRVVPGVCTCLGGVHATFCYEEIMAGNPEVDFIVRGEGELTVVELAGSLENDGSMDQVRGIVYRRNGVVTVNPARELISDLDTLKPAWDLLDWDIYRYNISGRRLGLVGLSRGCPHNCTFCSQHLFWQQTYRSRSAANFVAEIEMLHKEYGIGMFMMADEFTTCHRETWDQVLDLLIAKGMDIHISMETRADAVIRDADILPKYRQAGVIHVYVGVETVYQETLDRFGKDTTIDQSRQAIALLNQQGIITECSFILGTPDETEQNIDKTLATAMEFGPDLAHFLLLTPWPYTKLYDTVKSYLVETDYAKYHFVYPVIKPANMELDLLWTKLINCFRVFYMDKTRRVREMEPGFKKDYMATSLTIMQKEFFTTNFGPDTISLNAKNVAKIEKM